MTATAATVALLLAATSLPSVEAFRAALPASSLVPTGPHCASAPSSALRIPPQPAGVASWAPRPPRRQRAAASPMMMAAASPRERITITISSGPPSPVPGSPPSYTVRGTVYRSAGGEQQATWVVTKTYGDIEQWSYRANQRLGFLLPPLPPMEVAMGNLLALEAYLNQCLQTEALWRSADDLAFFEVPRAVLEGTAAADEEEDDDLTPSYIPDVYDEDGNPIRGQERDAQDVKKAATIAGAAAGFMLGGPFGAMLGAAAANAASGRSDTVGDVVRTAGKATNVAIRQVKKLDNQLDLTGKAKEALKRGYDVVKNAVDKLDEGS